ncbi:MAG: response regulator transcription factor [Dehalococcoidia bacterium]|nr:response regulator transcription factor [Dehalococcoidia bacterium]MCB9485761.1 response regulator transcription factor [Thermoflexaceae bacterium]
METPPTRYATTSDGQRIAYLHYPGVSPPFLTVSTPGVPPLSLRATMPAYGAGRWPRFLRGRAGVYFDWRGTGGSDPIAGQMSLHDLVADIDAVASAIGEPVDANFVGRASLAGCLHAVRNQARYRSIQITGGAIRAGENWQGLHSRPGWERNYREHLRSLARSYFDVSAAEAMRLAAHWEQGVPAHVRSAYLEADRGVDLTTVLPLITLPALVMALNPSDYEPAALMAALLPDSVLSLREPRASGPESGDTDREEWDRLLGARLGDLPSQPIPNSETTRRGFALTARERETLVALASGASNAEIAAAMTLSPRTVEYHLANIYSKLGVHSRVAAVNAARELGLA